MSAVTNANDLAPALFTVGLAILVASVLVAAFMAGVIVPLVEKRRQRRST